MPQLLKLHQTEHCPEEAWYADDEQDSLSISSDIDLDMALDDNNDGLSFHSDDTHSIMLEDPPLTEATNNPILDYTKTFV